MVGRQKKVDLTFFYLPFAPISRNLRRSPEKDNYKKVPTPVFDEEDDGRVYFAIGITGN